MIKKKKIGIIGCGAIGSFLARIVKTELSHCSELHFLCDRKEEKIQALRKKLRLRVQSGSIEDLVRASDFVIEAASTAVANQVASLILKNRKEGLIMSVGGMLDDAILRQVSKGGKIWVPSGALSGVDGLLAGREAWLSSVKLVTRKPPRGLAEAPYFQKVKFPVLKGNKEYRVFRGTAKEAVKYFPQNINVAAVLSLAGAGASKTKVEIWTSNRYRFNQHEVFISGKSGEIHTISRNVPSEENPKTSALAMYAAAATLKKIFSPLRIGT